MNFLKRFVFILILCLFVPAVHSHADEAATAHKEDYYQCSMHPWIISDKPGPCPICGMPLTKHSGHSDSQLVQGHVAIQIDSARRQQIGVTTEEVKERPMVYTIHSAGHVAYNPDVATLLAQYREAYLAYYKVRKNQVEKIRDQAMQLLEIAGLKLRLASMGSDQLEQIKIAGSNTLGVPNYFIPEELILPAGQVWVDTDLYETESELVRPGDKVRMDAPALPGLTFEGEVKMVDAVLNDFPRRVRVRIVTNSQGKLKASMALDVHIRVELGNKLTIPESALVDSGESRLVFVDDSNGNIEPRSVDVGELAGGYYEVISGLKAGEKVISSANFLIDSESRLRAAAEGFKQMNGEDGGPAVHHHTT